MGFFFSAINLDTRQSVPLVLQPRVGNTWTAAWKGVGPTCVCVCVMCVCVCVFGMCLCVSCVCVWCELCVCVLYMCVVL